MYVHSTLCWPQRQRPTTTSTNRDCVDRTCLQHMHNSCAVPSQDGYIAAHANSNKATTSCLWYPEAMMIQSIKRTCSNIMASIDARTPPHNY